MAVIEIPLDTGTALGPCTWAMDTGCCSNWGDLSSDVQDAAGAYASLILWAATGRKYGTCDLTVRPCGRECSAESGGVYWANGVWLPYVSNGQWRNCWCGAYGCSCEPSCQVYLPGPVTAVSSVYVDGTLVPAASYRVDNNQWLVRTDGLCWPDRQDYGIDTGDNTMSVTYTRGRGIPAALAAATGQLACEYAKACAGGTCGLPPRVSTIARQGVQLTYVNIDALLERGLTGFPQVDQVIVALNPNMLKTRLRLSSPDMPTTRQTTTP